MILYTIQPLSVLKKIQKGEYKTNPKKVMFPKHYQIYYNIAKKINKSAAPFPIWAWTKKPDLRAYRHEIGNKDSIREDVLLTLNVPDELVVKSNFELWHFILNEIPLLGSKRNWNKIFKTSEKDIAKIEKRIGKINRTEQATFPSIISSYVVSHKKLKVKVRSYKK